MYLSVALVSFNSLLEKILLETFNKIIITIIIDTDNIQKEFLSQKSKICDQFISKDSEGWKSAENKYRMQ